jgi:hypothetical protein
VAFIGSCVGEPLKRNVGCFPLMIDRAARKQAAETIRHFVAGQITNEEFIRRFPTSQQDPIIWALDDSVWCLYDDIRTHKLTGQWALPRQFKPEVVRWLMFLYSDQEYLWPKIGKPGFLQRPSWFHRFFKFARKRFERFHAGDYAVWPFLRREEFEDTRRKPYLLGGNIQQHVGPERR